MGKTCCGARGRASKTVASCSIITLFPSCNIGGKHNQGSGNECKPIGMKWNTTQLKQANELMQKPSGGQHACAMSRGGSEGDVP